MTNYTTTKEVDNYDILIQVLYTAKFTNDETMPGQEVEIHSWSITPFDENGDEINDLETILELKQHVSISELEEEIKCTL